VPTVNLHAQLASMYWLAPWWNPWRAAGQRVAARVLAGARVCDALNAEPQAAGGQPDSPYLGSEPFAKALTSVSPTTPIQFVPQTTLPEGIAYEAFIFESGQVPTRENLHDFFNGLAWLVFPQTKQRLNALQYGALAADGVQATRGALRDALTLFDENAAIWPCASGAASNGSTDTQNQVVDALRAKQWQHAFVNLRAHWQDNTPVLFGHALLEKLVAPYKSITAHVYIARVATNNVAISAVDSATAWQLNPAAMATKPFMPLPVLGVPLWWAANEDPAFYDDEQVFRPPRAMAAEKPVALSKP
jgi:Protein of unknown function (DUF3025)